MNFKTLCFALFLAVVLAQSEPKIIFNKNVDAATNYIGENHPFTIIYSIYNVGEATAYNVTINDQWPTEGFDHDGVYPIVIEELEAGASIEKNITATPRQSGYLETARAQLSYVTVDEQEQSHTYNGFSSSMGTLPILPEAQYKIYTSNTYLAWAIFILGVCAVIGYPLYKYFAPEQKPKSA
ncbi:hypothetical protein WA158_002824 [Blastocystis sp. Blastoise]